MAGQLFTQYFLTDGIRQTAVWRESVQNPCGFATFKRELGRRFAVLAGAQDPNEAFTESEVVRPVLDLLGWHFLPQEGTSGREDVPDQLLFAAADVKARAASRRDPGDRMREAVAIQESKRFGAPLDSRDGRARDALGSAHGQILRYLATADTIADADVRWGILTDGGVWRLYDYRTRPRASGFYEADLPALLAEDDDDALRAFYLLLRRDAFCRQDAATTTFLEDAIAEGKRYEQQVAQDLSGVVFERVFPSLVGALAAHTGAGESAQSDLAEARDAALIFLYRLLFVLYAEDRDLLPANDSRYDDYGLRTSVRMDVARRKAAGDTFSATASLYYRHLTELFRIIDRGDPSIGLPPYNGGLFAPDSAPLLERAAVPDSVLADVIYDLSHTSVGRGRGAARSYVNYRDMSVQQLGSIYERLLEQEPQRTANGAIVMRPNPYARKDSGSFYTPQELVDLIVEKTLTPLIEERLQAFEQQADALKHDRRPQSERRRALTDLDPAAAVLELKILDPAMGSGHFLVTAVDYVADYIADLMEYAPGVADWLAESYASPLVGRIADTRREILARAAEFDWTLDAALLTDQAIIRRMVLKRCIYGVDKNPLAVELAKVSLWLHSFTVGAPLSFLDHHLRCGDSLLGLRVTEGVAELNRAAGLGAQSAIAGAEAAAEGMARIEALSDADVTEVRESAALFAGVEETTADLRSLLDVLCGLRWLTAGMKKRERTLFEAPLFAMLGQRPQDAYALLAHGPDIRHSRAQSDRHSGESRIPEAPNREGDNARHSRAHNVRHSRESGNPSSPRPLDSGFHRSDETEAPYDRHTRVQSDRHSGESRNPEAPNREDDNARQSRAHNVRHSRESGKVDSHFKCNTWFMNTSAGVWYPRHLRGVWL